MRESAQVVLIICLFIIGLSIKLNEPSKKEHPKDCIRIGYYSWLADTIITEEMPKEKLIIKDGYFYFHDKKIKSKDIKLYCKF